MTISPLEAENAVIGSILIDPSCLRAVSGVLRGEDFGLEANRLLYEAAVRLDRENRPADPVLIRQEVQRAGGDVSAQYMMQLMELTPTAANVEEYADLTRENALRRGVQDILDRGREALAQHTPVGEVLGETEQALEELQQQGSRADLVTPTAGLEQFYQHRFAVEQNNTHGFVPTGYRDVDNVLGGGLLSSGMYVLAARPGMGKTTLALNIADRVARNTGPVLFVTLEMDPDQLEAKRLARESGVPSNKLLMHQLGEQENQRMAQASEALHTVPMYLNRTEKATVSEIKDMAKKVKNLSLVIIDYLGIITPEKRSRAASRYEYVTEISGDIKKMARKLRIPVLVLAQLNRASESRSDHRPQLSDLRDTGAIEQDADAVMFISRDVESFGSEPDRYAPEPLDIIIAKNRHGATGECPLSFALATSKVSTQDNDPRKAYRKSQEFQQQLRMDQGGEAP